MFASDSQLKQHMKAIKHDPPYAAARLPALKGMPGKVPTKATTSPRTEPTLTTTLTSSEASQGLKCGWCPHKVFKDTEALQQHRDAKHPRCPICLKVFHNKYRKGQVQFAEEQLAAHRQETGHATPTSHSTSYGGHDQSNSSDAGHGSEEERVSLSELSPTVTDEDLIDLEDNETGVPSPGSLSDLMTFQSEDEQEQYEDDGEDGGVELA